MLGTASFPARLAAGAPIPEPVALVLAHPDDELVGLGAHLHLFERLTLIHVTDGAPLDLGDALHAGFATRAAYAAARRAECEAGVVEACARPERWLRYDLTDQTAVDQVGEIAARLAHDLAGVAAVFTHAYEGGHPDHDACALAVQRACAAMADPPERLEFAGYYGVGGARFVNRFHPDPEHPETAVALTPAQRARKSAAFARHASQGRVLAEFPVEREAWRTAPTYDFTRPPPPGEALYDGFEWGLTSAGWRERLLLPLREKEGARDALAS